jgi:hypothetical protein
MTASNLAKVIGPNILYSETEGVNLESINAVNSLLENLIINYPELYETNVCSIERERDREREREKERWCMYVCVH